VYGNVMLWKGGRAHLLGPYSGQDENAISNSVHKFNRISKSEKEERKDD
jgi:hypothetical protein